MKRPLRIGAPFTMARANGNAPFDDASSHSPEVRDGVMLRPMLLFRRLVLVLRVYAVGLWLFGWIVLGAIVAPVQFRMVPSPYAAEAMTTIFRRFDTIALACAAVVWMTDVLLGSGGDSRVRTAKRSVSAIATIALFVESFVIAPRIDDLFHAGAIRGLGPEGETLNAWHRAAEGAGKLQVLTLLLLLALELYELVVTKAAVALAPVVPVVPVAPSPAESASLPAAESATTTSDEPLAR
jgi:hypothetical protein